MARRGPQLRVRDLLPHADLVRARHARVSGPAGRDSVHDLAQRDSRRPAARGGGATPRRSSRDRTLHRVRVLRGPDRRRAGRRAGTRHGSIGARFGAASSSSSSPRIHSLPSRAPRFRAVGVREDFTDVLSLADGCPAVAARFTSERRREIKKGRESGVRTRIATTLDDYRSYFAAYEDSLRRWGERVTLRYPWELFEVCHDLARRYPDAREVVAGRARRRDSRRRPELLLEPTRRRLALRGLHPCARFVRLRDPGRGCGGGGLRAWVRVVRPQSERRAGGSRSLQEPLRWRAQADRASPLPDVAAPVRRPRQERGRA